MGACNVQASSPKDNGYNSFLTDKSYPSSKEASELCSKCRKYPFTYDEVDGYVFIGPNGKVIFVPNGEYWTCSYIDSYRTWTWSPDGSSSKKQYRKQSANSSSIYFYDYNGIGREVERY